MSSFTYPPSGGGVPVYANLASFPSASQAGNGALAIALDTDILYISTGSAWASIGGTSVPLMVGAFGSTPNASGLTLSSNTLTMQPADATHSGGLATADWNTFNNKAAPDLSNLTSPTSINQDLLPQFPGVNAGSFSNPFVFTGLDFIIDNQSLNAPIGDIGNDSLDNVLFNATNKLILKPAQLRIQDGSQGTSGHIWTSTDTVGSGHWAVNPGVGAITALTGDVTATGPGSAVATVSNLAITNAKIANSTIDLTAKVTNILPAANGGAPPVTRYFYVDKNRTDSFTADGSLARPFATIGAAISQVITNADNSTHPYTINVIPGAYAETLSFNSTALYNLVISASISASTPLQDLSVTGITSTSNNTQLATLIFNGFTINGNLNLTGDINGTNFASSQVLFSSCQFNNSSGTIVLNNINNVNFYNCQIQGSGSVSTFTNVAMGYMNGAEGFIGGTTLHLVDNPGGNVPSQYSGNYLLFNQTKFYGTVTVDAGSELDTLTSYFGSTSVVTNNGTIHSWATNWSSATTAVALNSGSTTRTRGDFFYLPPTVNAAATFTLQGEFVAANLELAQIATPGNPASGHDKLYFKSDDKLYGLSHAGTETLIGPQLAGLTTDGVIYATSATAAASTAAGTSGYPLVSAGGGGSPPTFSQLSLTAGVTGVLPIANGGTNNGSLAVTAGGVVYTDGTKLQNTGAGTSGQFLQSQGASAPIWTGGTVANNWSGYHANGMTWTVTSTTFADMSSTGTTPAVTQRTGSGITVTTAASNQPGIHFSPASSSAVYLIKASFAYEENGQFQSFQLTDGTAVIQSSEAGAHANTNQTNITLVGLYKPGTSSPVDVRIQAAAGSGASIIQNSVAPATAIEWTVTQLPTSFVSNAGNPFDFFASSQVTTLSTGITSGTFGTFSNSPAFTFTPNFTGTYKVYSSVPLEQDTVNTFGVIRVVNTSGGATLLKESQAWLEVPGTGSDTGASAQTQSVYTLNSGTSYVFDIQGKVSGGSLFIEGNNSPFYIFAERIG